MAMSKTPAYLIWYDIDFEHTYQIHKINHDFQWYNILTLKFKKWNTFFQKRNSFKLALQRHTNT